MPRSLRRVIFWTHLTAGLLLALPVFLLCVTGLFMTYERQVEGWIDRWDFKPHLAKPGAPGLEAEALIRAIYKARGVDPGSITVFADVTRPVEVQLDGKPPRVIYLDPYTGVIVGEPSRRIRCVFEKIRAVHLALGVRGAHHDWFRGLIKCTNLAALFLAVLGALLWIPRRWTWQHIRPTVTLRLGLTGRARDFNWHNAIGIWSVAPLLVIVWTATALSYGWARNLTERAIDAANSEWLSMRAAGGSGFVAAIEPAENGSAKTPPMSLGALLAVAKMQMPGWKAITMLVPSQDSARVYFTGDMSGDGIRRVSALGLNRAGRVVSFVPAGASGVSSAIFVRYGHTGEAWGVAGQTIAGIASFGGAMLVWTGVSLSIRRLRSWLKRTRAPVSQNVLA